MNKKIAFWGSIASIVSLVLAITLGGNTFKNSGGNQTVMQADGGGVNIVENNGPVLSGNNNNNTVTIKHEHPVPEYFVSLHGRRNVFPNDVIKFSIDADQPIHLSNISCDWKVFVSGNVEYESGIDGCILTFTLIDVPVNRGSERVVISAMITKDGREFRAKDMELMASPDYYSAGYLKHNAKKLRKNDDKGYMAWLDSIDGASIEDLYALRAALDNEDYEQAERIAVKLVSTAKMGESMEEETLRLLKDKLPNINQKVNTMIEEASDQHFKDNIADVFSGKLKSKDFSEAQKLYLEKLEENKFFLEEGLNKDAASKINNEYVKAINTGDYVSASEKIETLFEESNKNKTVR